MLEILMSPERLRTASREPKTTEQLETMTLDQKDAPISRSKTTNSNPNGSEQVCRLTDCQGS